MDRHGREIPTQDRKYVWLGNLLLDGTRAFTTGVARPADAITVTKPLGDDGLYRLFNKMECTLNTNYMSGVLACAGATIQFHYETFHNVNSRVLLYGDVNTGKTTSLKCAMSIVGQHQGHVYSSLSDAFFAKLASATTLGFGLDDPTDPRSLGELLLGFYTRCYRGRCSNEIEPKCGTLVSVNPFVLHCEVQGMYLHSSDQNLLLLFLTICFLQVPF